MSLTAEAQTYLRSYVAAEPGLTHTRQRTLQRYVAEALAELERLQAVVTRRGELLRRAFVTIDAAYADHPVALAIAAELAEGEDGDA